MTSPIVTIANAFTIMSDDAESCLCCIFTPVPKDRADGFCSDTCRDWYNGQMMQIAEKAFRAETGEDGS